MAVLNLASRLMELPIGVFAVAVSTVVFPLISKYAVAGDWPNLAQSYRKGMRLILVINIPAANIVFPVGYIPIVNPFDGYTDIVTTTIIPTADATGTLDPLSGDAVINLAFRVRIGGTVSGNAISSNCTIGTAATSAMGAMSRDGSNGMLR